MNQKSNGITKMKISVLILVILIVIVMIDMVGSQNRNRRRGRVRKQPKKMCTPVCIRFCKSITPFGGQVCRYLCGRFCRGKREVSQYLLDGYYIKPMPCDFGAYDHNGNNIMSRAELAHQNGGTGEEEDVKEVFTIMDVDNDGGVSRDEFEEAPLLKDCDKQVSEAEGVL